MTLRQRALARLRGEQTVARMRKRGLRAHPPIRIAARTVIDPDFVWAVEIGAYTVIASDVRIIAHDAASKRLTGYTEVRPVTIGERCYIGTGAIVLPGSVIHDDAVIGAGAVVRGEIPAMSLAVGAPARVVGTVTELCQRHLAQMDACLRLERRSSELGAEDIGRLERALTEDGRLYLL